VLVYSEGDICCNGAGNCAGCRSGGRNMSKRGQNMTKRRRNMAGKCVKYDGKGSKRGRRKCERGVGSKRSENVCRKDAYAKGEDEAPDLPFLSERCSV
jgi:hypothetical protein